MIIVIFIQMMHMGVCDTKSSGKKHPSGPFY